MNLIDEQHVMLLQIRQQRGEVSLPLNCRS